MQRRHVLLALLPLLALPAAGQTFEEQVVELTNQERWTNGQLPPLKLCPLLAGAAAGHSAAMSTRDFFSSCDLDSGTVPADRIQAAGYLGSAVTENIGASFATPSALMSAWMFGLGTRDHILSTAYREVGVGFVNDPADQATVRFDDGFCQAAPGLNGPYFNYWTQDFGFRDDVFPLVINREAYETNTRAVDLYVYGAGWGIKMRFRNETSIWSAWELFATDKAWFLSAGDGMKTVEVEILGPGAEVRSFADTILLSGSVVGVPHPRTTGPVTLHPARPNPFRSTTTLAFELGETGPARLTAFDAAGRRVATVADGVFAAGFHDIPWSGRDDRGQRLPAGLYFLRLDAAGSARTTKLLLTP